MSADSSAGLDDESRFEMLYCDSGRCRVDTFERGAAGSCPGCGSQGEPIPPRMLR